MKILFTGPESSGKTTVATMAAEKLGIPVVMEMARPFLDIRSDKYSFADLEEIALLQRYEESFVRHSSNAYICDTDLLTIIIWARDKFGNENADWSNWWLRDRPDFIFLCLPDIPWEPDSLRENPLDRDRLVAEYVSQIHRFEADFVTLHGDKQTRLAKVLKTLGR
jgi:nicotinamide riboside kinase